MSELTDYEIKRRIQITSKIIASGEAAGCTYASRARSYQRLGKYDEALNDFNKSLELNPNTHLFSPDIYLDRADLCFFKMQKYDEAIKDYIKVAELYYDDFYFPEHILNITDYTELLYDFSQKIKLEPDNPELYLNRGIIYLRTEYFLQAADDFKEAIRLNSQYSDSVVHLLLVCYITHGNDLTNEKRHNKNLVYCKRISCPNAFFLSWINFRIKRYSDEAIKCYNDAIELDPENLKLHRLHSYACEINEDFAKSVENLTEAIKLASDDNIYLPSLYYARACAYREQGFNKEAEKDCNKIKEIASEFFPFTFKFYLENEDYAKALQDVKESGLYNFSVWINRQLACIGTRMKWASHLVPVPKPCVKDIHGDPDFPLGQFQKHYYSVINDMIYERRMDKEKRERILELSDKIFYNVIVELYPKSLKSYLHRSIYFMKRNEYHDAIKDFDKCIELYPDNTLKNIHMPIEFIYFFRGICNGEIGKIEEANKDFKRVVDSYSYNPAKLEGNKPPFIKINSFIAGKYPRNFFGLFFGSNFTKLNYSKFLIFVAENSSIEMMLRSMDIFQGNFIGIESLRLAECLDNLDWRRIEYNIFSGRRFDALVSQIFSHYPNHEKSLKYLLERDGEDSFFLFVKLSFLKLLLSKFWNVEEKNSTISVEDDLIIDRFIRFMPNDNQRINFISMYFHLDGKGKDREKYLLEKQKERERSQAKIEHQRELSELRTNIFQAVSHTISNIMLANKSLTKRIKNGTNTINDVNRLELLNDLVLSTMKAIKLVFSKEDIVASKAPDDLSWEKIKDGISLHNLLYFCLNINLHNLVNGEGEEGGWETMREIFFFFDEYDEDVDEKLTLFNEMKASPEFSISELSEESVLDFVEELQTETFYPIYRFFTFRLDEFKSLYVKRDSYTFAVLFIIFLELTKNMLRYGTVEDGDARKFVMECADEGDSFVLTMTNVCEKSGLNLKQSTLQGLAMIQEFSKVVGRFEKIEKDIDDSDFLEFTTTLFIKKPMDSLNCDFQD